jgi:hypothetical protein
MTNSLSQQQILNQVFDSVTDCLQVELGANTGVDLALSSATDSITTVPTNTAQKASLTPDNTGVVMGPFSIVGMSSLQLYTNTTSALTGAQTCTLQISPSDTDNVWLSTSLTATPSDTASAVESGGALTGVVARRAQVVIAAAISTGGFDLYCVGHS